MNFSVLNKYLKSKRPGLKIVSVFFALTVVANSALAAAAPTVDSVSVNNGTTAGGTNVTITGTNFLGAYSNTNLMLHGDGTGATFVDSETTPKTISAYGAATQSIAQSKFGGASMSFNGTNSYLTVPDSTDWNFGTGNFTIDWWEYRTSATGCSIARDDGNYSPFLLGYGSGLIYMTSSGSSWDIASGRTFGASVLNAWSHLAIVRSGNTFYAFRDGLQRDTWTSTLPMQTVAANLQIGRAQGGQYFPGYIDELHVSKGIANWTAPFAPPTTQYYPTQNVTFGGTSATNVAVVSPTTITATTPAHLAGAVDVVATNYDGQSSTLTNGYTFNPALTISSLSPSSAKKTGGDTITITGSGFYGTPSVTLGGVAATFVTVVNPTTITAITPAHAVGQVSVTITGSDLQSATLTNGFTFLDFPPTVSVISPSSGSVAGGTNVTITGTNFLPQNTGGDAGWATVAGKTLPGNLSSSQIVTIGNSLYLFGGLGATATNAIYTASVADPTTWTIVAGKTLPASLYASQLAIVGNNLYLFGGNNGAAATNVIYTASVADPTTWTIVAGKTLPGALYYSQLATVGNNLYLLGGTINGASATNVIYTASTADPTTWTAVAGKTLPVTLGYSHLATIGNNLYLFGGYNGAGVTSAIYTATVADPTTWTLVAGKTLPGVLYASQLAVVGNNMYLFGGYNGAATNIIYTASVFNPTTWTTSVSTLPAAFQFSSTAIIDSNVYLFGGTVNAIYRAPVQYFRGNIFNKAWITNWRTVATDQSNVTIGGTQATNINFASATSITATMPAHLAGATDVVVTNYDGQAATLTNGYTYNPAPTLSAGAVSPASAKLTGGDTITITGADFYGTPTVTLGGTAATAVTVVNSTTITATTPAHAAGQVDVVITNPDSQSATLTNGFTFMELPPTVGAVSPSSGPVSGGTNVTITGTNFINGLSATGGTITTSGPYTIHTFTSNETFVANGSGNVEYLIVGGGGGGGRYGGGGGAGGFRTGVLGGLVPGSYAISVGAGGSGWVGDAQSGGNAASGSNSSFNNIISAGGGGAGNFGAATGGSVGLNGGSGGGSGCFASAVGSSGSNSLGNIPVTTPPQGSGGGNSTIAYTSSSCGGGGGASASGANGVSGGGGGIGSQSSITGTATYYAGGGSGSQISSVLAGGLGGGGYGQIANTSLANIDGVNGLGGGGGGGRDGTVGGIWRAGNGGSGVVIIRYLTPNPVTVSVGGVPATNVAVTSPTTITATVPAHIAGTTNVVVTNYDGQSATLTNGYIFNPTPTLSSVSPASAKFTGGDTITITGADFYGTPTVTLGGTAATLVTVVNPTTITATTPAHAVGQVDVVITNPDSQSATLTNGFTFTELPPTFSSISPSSGPAAGGANVAISGANFLNVTDANTKLLLHGDGTGASFVDSETTPKTITAVGSVTQSATQSKFGGKSAYLDGTNSYLSVANSTDFDFGSDDFTIDWWQYSSTVGGFRFSMARNDNPYPPFLVGFNGSSSLTIYMSSNNTGFDIASGKSLGTPVANTWYHYSIVRSGNAFYTFRDGIQQDTWTSAGSIAAGGANLLIGRYNGANNFNGYIDEVRVSKGVARWTGNFTPLASAYGQPSVTIGGTSAININLVSPTSITATTPTHTAGATDVVVTNYDGQAATLTSGYTFNEAPTLGAGAVSPASAKFTGGDTIAITGTGFYGAPTVTLGGAAATAVTVVNPTTITATTPAHAVGQVDVVITNPDSQSATLTNGFTFNELPPTVGSISPNNGSAGGGTNVTITGTNFLSPDANTKLLLHNDGTGATFVDSEIMPKTITAFGGATQSNTKSKFGGTSASFDGINSYLRIPYTSDLDMSTGDFTFDTWFNMNSFATTGIIYSKDTYGSNLDFSLQIINSTSIILYTNGGGTTLAATLPTMATGTWYHLAVVRSAGTNNIYLNGVSYASNTMAITNLSQSYITIGSGSWNNPGAFLNGYLDELRVSKGVARWTSNFTVPTIPYSSNPIVNIGGTSANNVVVTSSTSITATTPAHIAGATDVVVTNYDGQAATLTNGFEYHNWITSGTYTSTVKPLANTGFGDITWIANTPASTNLTMRVKSCATSDCSDKPSWTGCDLLLTDNNTDISGKGCVVDGQGYAQYQIYLSTDSASAQPYLDSVTIATQPEYSKTFLNLISSPFDTGSKSSSVQKISWTAVNDNSTTQGAVTMQIRTAPDNGGAPDFTNSLWCGPTDCSATPNSTSVFATSFYTDKTGATAINNLNKDLNGDRWIQYATFLKSVDGIVTPTLSNVTMQYAYNIPPVITGVGYTQNADGTVSVPYTLSETYDDFSSIPHGTSGSPIKALLFYQPQNDVTTPALTDVQTGIIALNNPSSAPIPSQGTMLVDDELIAFDSVGATGNQRNIIARAQTFVTSYPTFASTHLANTAVFFLATRKADGSALSHTIDTLAASGAVGSQASINNTFAWDPKNDPYLNLAGQKLVGVIFKVAANDADATNINNIGQSATTAAQALDLENPKIKNITSSTADGRYNTGKNVDVTINFADSLGNAKNVSSTGAVTIKLETGVNDYNCTVSNITNSSSASCTYQVQAGDDSADLTAISVAGVIRDQFGNQISDFTIPAGQNIADLKNIVIDSLSPIISDVIPAANAFINSTTGANGGSDVSYNANEQLKTGSFIKFISTAGVDLNAQYVCTLQGAALALGTHNRFEMKQGADNCVEVQAALQSGSAYTLSIHAIDEADNFSDATSLTITFDTTNPTASITAPANDAFIRNITNDSAISYNLSEPLQVGSYLKLTRTGGSSDSQSPRSCSLSGNELIAGDHNKVDLNAVCGGFTLVDGAIYTVDFHAVDRAENSGDASQKTNVTFDTTAPVLTSFTSNKANNTPATGYGKDEVIDIRAVYGENLAAGSTVTVQLENTASPAVNVVLNQIAGNVVSGSFTVDGPRKGYDVADLTIRSIVSENIVDIAGNIKTNSAIPSGQNLGDTKDIAIDTGTPILLSFEAKKLPAITGGSFKEGEQLKITANYSKPIASGSLTVHLNTENGGEDNSDITLSTIAGSTLSTVYSVAANDNATDFKVFAITAQSATDFKGNVLNRTGAMSDYDAYFTSLVGENISAVANIVNFQIDTTAPVLGAFPIAIENVSGKTSLANPNIALSASDNFDLADGKMLFSLDGGVSYCAPIDYAAQTSSFDITAGACGGNIANGNKTVTVKFRDAAGNESVTANASVDYDNSKPQIQSFTTDTVDGVYGPASAIKIVASYDENIIGGTLVINLNNGKQLTLSTLENSNQLTGVYTVGSAGEDTNKLRVAAIVSQSTSDTAGPANVQAGTSLAGIAENLDTTKTIAIDNIAPVGKVTIDRSKTSGQIHLSATDTNGSNMQTQIVALTTHEGSCDFAGATWVAYADNIDTDLAENASSARKVCALFKDNVGNISSEAIALTPETPTGVLLDDISNSALNPPFFGQILTWQIPVVMGTDNLFSKYEVLLCQTDANSDCTPALPTEPKQTITDLNTNYFVYSQQTAQTKYCYQMRFADVHGDYSAPSVKQCLKSGEVPAIADSQTTIISSQDQDIKITDISSSGATVLFSTKDSRHNNRPLPTLATVYLYSDPQMTQLVKTSEPEADYTVSHMVALTGLESGTQYYLKISATDSSAVTNPYRTAEISYVPNTQPALTFTTAGTLSKILIDENQPAIITGDKAVVNFSTDQKAKCFIDFKEAAIDSYNEINSVVESEEMKEHSITISSLLAERKYDYKITCYDNDDRSIIVTKGVAGDLLPSFTTLSAAAVGNENDKTAPQISSVSLANIVGESATITWNTDEKANSLVAYEMEGALYTMMSGDYTVNADTAKYGTAHSVMVGGLLPASKYTFTVISTDMAGNIAQSAQATFTTKQPSTLSSVSVLSKALGQATVTWTTGASTSSIVEYGLSSAYGQRKEDASKTKEHVITLSDLTPGETYHFRVKGEDDQQNVFASSDITFQPKAPPKISNFKIDQITEHGATVSFLTNVPTDSLVTYTDADNAENSGFQGKPEVATKHEMQLKNIESGKTYGVKLKVRDEEGNETEETFENFTTTKDEAAPTIDRVKTDAALTQNDKVQAIISWTTDEMATGKVVYKEGKTGEEKTFEVNKSLSFSHIGVITSFKPGLVYYFKVISADQVGNIANSTDYAVLTPKKRQNIIQVIIGNFTDIFGWAKF